LILREIVAPVLRVRSFPDFVPATRKRVASTQSGLRQFYVVFTGPLWVIKEPR
jgi:hypothetical protein